MTRCPLCGGTLEWALRNYTFSFAGEAPLEVRPRVRVCTGCGEGFAAPGEARQPFEMAESLLRRRHRWPAGRGLGRLRRQMGLSAEELGRLLGVGPEEIVRLEAGGSPSPVVLRRFGWVRTLSPELRARVLQGPRIHLLN